jgi:hypothetical protein
MHKNAMKCTKTLSKWCKNKHGASKIIDTFETYQRVRRTQVPKGFKLPHDQRKYGGSHEPESWLSDYLQAVKLLGHSRATTMRSLQLHLTGAARSWLSKLPDDSIGSWGELKNNLQASSDQHTHDQHQ